MREAYSLYRKWGALAKAEHLTKRYPNLMIGHRIAVDESRTGVIFDQISGDLDLMTILKTSQAVAGEIELDSLLDILMTSAIENSGAQQGFLLLQEGNQWVIAAQADLDKSVSQAENSVPITESDLLSDDIVHYVARTQDTVLLDDASQSGGFVDDPYFQRHEVKSLLCTPLVNQGKTSAILYLQNDLAPGVFTPERVSLLQLLSSQMAISIDNARTHDQLEKLLEERSKALSSAEEQIRAIFENSPLGITLSNFEGQFLTVNQALLDMLRISEEEALQRNVTDFYTDPGDRAALLAELQESGSVQGFGVQLIRNDGSSFFASLNISRLVLEGNEVLLTLVEDVTESEERFRATFEQAAVGIDHEAPGGRFLRVNQKFCDIVGYSREEMLGRTYQDITHPDDLDIDHENAKRLLDGQLESYPIEKRYLRKNGEIVWVNITVSLVREDKGGPSYFISVVEDITERKQAEEALQKSEKRFKDVADNASEWIWEVDSSGKYTYVSPVVESVLGYKPEELLQKHFYDLFYPDDKEELKRAAFEVFAREENFVKFTNRNVHKNGKEVWLSTSGLPIIDERGELLGYRGADTDITRRKQAEQALRDTERQYRTLDLEPLLELTLDHLSRIVDYDSASIWIRERDSLVIRADHVPEGAPSLVGMLVSTEASPMFRQIMETREAFFVDDISKHRDLVQGLLPDTELPSETEFSWLAVPVVAKNQVIGIFSLVYNLSGYYSDTVVEHTQVLADRAAIAIENARLHEQVQQTVISEERARLARELHDSVSQTLFSAGMIADAMPILWDKDRGMGQQNLELLSVLIRGASAEMRSLLLELRPDTLRDQTLGKLLETLAIATRARTQAVVSLKVEGECQLQEDVIMAFHRIAQEILNNIAKHAEASEVIIDLSCDPESTKLCKLCIQDDGRGFDPQAIPAGHLGIGIMRERAQKIGADIKIDSEIGRGTQVSVSWSAAGKESASGDKTEHE
jgi:PAS domain S-box-containing protein